MPSSADVRIGERFGGELGLHGKVASNVDQVVHMAGRRRLQAAPHRLRHAAYGRSSSASCIGLQAASAASSAASPADGGSNTSTAARSASGARTSVAWPAEAAARRNRGPRFRSACGRHPDEAAAPIVEMSERGFAEADGESRRPRGSES